MRLLANAARLCARMSQPGSFFSRAISSVSSPVAARGAPAFGRAARIRPAAQSWWANPLWDCSAQEGAGCEGQGELLRFAGEHCQQGGPDCGVPVTAVC